MDKIKTTIFAALLIGIIWAPAASADTPAANITVISGNGQMPCPTCAQKFFRTFYPLTVKVTDSSGMPIAGKVVSWQVTYSIGSVALVDQQSTTDSGGFASANYFQAYVGGTSGTPFLQSTVVAIADGLTATFHVTQALTDQSAFAAQLVFARLDSPIDGSTGKSIGSGPAGSRGSAAIQVHVDGRGIPVPNISVRLLNNDPNLLPSAVCASQAGADPGSVLTDENGNATCNPVFGQVPGNGTLSVLVGGLDPANYSYSNISIPLPLTAAVAFDQYAGIQFNVTPVTPALLQIVSSGNNQSINPGQTSSPLVVLVTDATGQVPVASPNVVTWTVTPTTGAFLTKTTSSSDSSGLAQTALTLTQSAIGQYSVKASLTATPSVSVTFTVNTNVQISSMTKVSGDIQTAPANQGFASPLVVQVNGSNAQVLPSVPVNFTISGPGTLSANSAFTDSTGRAQVSVKAGANPGTITVVASVANISQTFTLTVVPPGPSLTSASFVNAAGRTSALSPCSLATAVATGLAPSLNGLVLQSSAFGPWGTTLAGDTVTVNNVAAPIYSVGTVSGAEQVTFQIPCEAAVGSSVPVTINVSGGAASATITLVSASPGIFETVMSDNVRRAVALRPDGSFVSLQNPARRGEVVRILLTGMGATTPAVTTGALPVPGSDALVSNPVVVGVNNAGTRVVTARLSPNLIGVFEVAFQIPSDAPTGNDIVLSVTVNAPERHDSNGSKIPIQ